MSSVVEPKEATSTMGKWKEKFWAFLTKTDHPTKLPLKVKNAYIFMIMIIFAALFCF